MDPGWHKPRFRVPEPRRLSPTPEVIEYFAGRPHHAL